MTREEILQSTFTADEIKSNVEELYDQVGKELAKGHFELNETIANCFEEIDIYENKCAELGHEFVDGECIFCHALEHPEEV